MRFKREKVGKWDKYASVSKWLIIFEKLDLVTNGFLNSEVDEKKISKRKNFKKRRKLQIDNGMTLLLITFLGITVSLVSFVGYVLKQEPESLFRKQITEFPVPCEDLSLSADEDFLTFDARKRNLRTFVDDKGKYICAKKDISETIKTVVERAARYRLARGLEELYLSCGNKSLAEKSGHRTVSFTEISEHQNYSDDNIYSDIKLQWNNQTGKCYLDPSVQYDNGELTIPEGRTYFVYASVHFNISRQENFGINKFARPQRISIRLCTSVYGYERTLLGRTELFNMTNTENVVSSLRIGSHLELSRDDKIYVRVSNANKIIHDSKGTTFGLFPL